MSPLTAADPTAIQQSWQDTIHARSDSAVWSLLDYALQSPAINAASAAKILAMSAHRSRAGIEQLEAEGILHTISTSRRNRI